MKYLYMFPIVVGLMVSASSLAKADPHQDLAHQIKAEIVQVEVEALLDTYRELTQRIHELQLERVHLEVEVETAGDQAERVALEQQLRRVHITRDRMEHLRAETREKLHHHAEGLSQHSHAHGAGRHEEDHGDHSDRHHEDCGEECKDECEEHEEHGEHEGRHHGDHDGRHHEDAHEGHDDHSSKADVLRKKLHHLEREIEELHDAGKHEHAEKLEHHVREIHQQLEGDAGRHHDGHEDHGSHDARHHDGDRAHAKMRAYSEQLQSKRHGVEARLEKLKVALVQVEGDDDEAQKKRRQMKQRMAGLESQHKAIMEKMEGLKRRSGEHHDHETHKD